MLISALKYLLQSAKLFIVLWTWDHEYFDQSIIFQDLLQLSHDEMADIFAKWNEGQLDSFLIDITKDILRFKDKATGDALVTKIRDAAGQKVRF